MNTTTNMPATRITTPAATPRRGARRWLALGAGVLLLAAVPGMPGVGLVSAPSAAAGDVGWCITVGSGGHASANVHYRSGGDRGHYQSVWRPAVYQTRYDSCGRAYQVCVRAGYYEQVYVPGRSGYYAQARYDNHRDYGRRGYEQPRSRYDGYRSGGWDRGSRHGWKQHDSRRQSWFDACDSRGRRGRY